MKKIELYGVSLIFLFLAVVAVSSFVRSQHALSEMRAALAGGVK